MLTNKLSILFTHTVPVLPKAKHNSTAISQKEAEAAAAIEIYNSRFSTILHRCIGDNGKVIIIRDGEHLKHLIINEGFSLKQAQTPGCYYLSRGLEGGGRLEEIALKLDTKPHGQKSVFISYCWAQKNVAIAIEVEFNARGYLVIRDENELSSGVNLLKFMKLINHNNMDYVVPIISSNYLKSNNCMREVIEMRNRYDKKTILPCIIDSGASSGTSIFSSDGKNNILKHWQGELLKAEQAKNFGDQTLMRSITTDLPLFLKDITKHLYTTSSKLESEKYQGLFDLIEKAEAETAKGNSKFGAVRELLDHAKYDFDVEEYLTAEEGYKKAIELLKQLKDTSPAGKQLNAIAYGGYAECLKYRDSPDHPKFLRIAHTFRHVATDKPIEIDADKLMIAIKQAKEKSDISFLITMLEKNIPNQCKEQAAWALMLLAINPENRVTIAQAGAIPRLVALLEKNMPNQCKIHAASVLSWLAANTENKVTIVQAGAIPLLVAMLEKNMPNKCKEQAAAALSWLAANTENKVTIAKAGAIPLLTAMLEKNMPDECKEQAAGALSFFR